MNRTLRILDANANRAREAMRVMEEAARFVLDSAELAQQVKVLRHDLAAAMRRLPDHVAVELHRDTAHDVGTGISTQAEQTRNSVREVVTAAGKRLTEALRCLEEYGKIVSPKFAASIQALRYRAYQVESALHQHLPSARARQWQLCVLISASLCTHHAWFDVAQAALDGGADCIQLREKTLEAGELLQRASRLVELARGYGTSGKRGQPKVRPAIIINDRPDIAAAAEADGVHMGTGDLPIDATRKIVGSAMIIGASTHNLAEARRAVTAGADYCGIGAMFPSSTKSRKPATPIYLSRFIEKYPHVPHLAIGGITLENVAELVCAGAKGIAVSSVVCNSPSPQTVVKKLLKKLN